MKAAGGRAVKQLVFIFLNISSNDFHENRLELQRAVVMLCVTLTHSHTHQPSRSKTNFSDQITAAAQNRQSNH